MVIAIDGYAGSGKSTLAKALSQKIGYHSFNTGMIFRAIAYLMLKKNVKENELEKLEKTIEESNLNVAFYEENQYIYIGNEDITPYLTSTEVSKYSSIYSQIPLIRKKVVEFQHKFSDKFDLVVEGRDIGTEVFPDAKYKFFVTASIDERANRRFADLKKQYPNITIDEIKQSLAERDYNDTHRQISPLKQADDAILIDTTGKTIEQSLEKMLSYIEQCDLK